MKYFTTTFFCILFSIIFMLLVSKISSASSSTGSIIFPLTQQFFTVKNHPQNNTIQFQLQQKDAEIQKLQTENTALHYQFQASIVPSKILIPASIVGAPSFIPGITLPEYFIINKGTQDNVTKGEISIYQNNAIGKVTQTTNHYSQVTFITDPTVSMIGKDLKTGALGTLKGQDNGEMLLDNVLLSDHLQIGDTIVTKGEVNLKGLGFPPGIFIGKITAIEKTPQNLFQQARIKSFIDITKLTTIFILKSQ